MALQLFKLVVASTLSDTQYFQSATQIYTIGTAATTIAATSFLNGDGTNVTAFNTATTNGYYSLEISGVLQQTGIYTVSAAGLSIQLASGTSTILLSAPITLTVTESTITS